MTDVAHAVEEARTPPWIFGLLAVSAGLTVANLYYNQPLLAAMSTDFGVTPRAAGAIPTLTQLGYGLGMLLLVPLGDRFERRGLITKMTGAAAIALVGVTFAPSLETLIAASLVLGLASMVPQYIVPYAATAAHPSARGKAVGTVMSGLLIGILLSRTVSGFVASRFGWRAMYGLASILMIALAVVLRAFLPVQSPPRRVPFGELYGSLVTLVRDQPILRLHSALGALTFACFSIFWSTLAFHLADLPAHYGSGVTGAFGIVGVVGALAAPLVGRYADKRDPRVINLIAILTVFVSFVVFGFAGRSLAGIAVGVVLLDLGAQANHISNQTRIFSLDPALRNRLNTVYMSSYFAGGALGSWSAAVAWSAYGWRGVCFTGGVFAVGACLLFAIAGGRTPGRPLHASREG